MNYFAIHKLTREMRPLPVNGTAYADEIIVEKNANGFLCYKNPSINEVRNTLRVLGFEQEGAGPWTRGDDVTAIFHDSDGNWGAVVG